MPHNKIDAIPDFSSDTPAPGGVSEEVKQPVVEEPAVEAKETPEPPAEEPTTPTGSDDTTETPVVATPEPSMPSPGQITGLQNELVNLRKQISDLRGEKRMLKQQQIDRVQAQIDELKDLHPEDIQVIDRVLKAKGYMSKEEVERMFSENARQSVLDEFLEKYPEYKAENDPSDSNWRALEKELAYYRMPNDPKQIREILERAHKAIVRVTPSAAVIAPKQHQVRIASMGSGGTPKPSSTTTKLDPDKRSMLARGGFSEEEIQNMEKKLG